MSAAYDQLRSEPSVKVTIAACESVDSKGYEIFFFPKVCWFVWEKFTAANVAQYK